jgi:hypothetical protein
MFKERVEVQLYSLSGPSWPAIRQMLLFYIQQIKIFVAQVADGVFYFNTGNQTVWNAIPQ